jgi:hypothetical protein
MKSLKIHYKVACPLMKIDADVESDCEGCVHFNGTDHFNEFVECTQDEEVEQT